MANFIRPSTVQKIGALLQKGHSIRSVSKALGVNRGTVCKYALKFQPEKCVCGKEARHRGWCGPKYLKSSVHKELVAKVHADFVEGPRPAKRQPLTNYRRLSYPYCIGGPSEGNALLMAVNAAVSKSLPDDSRADVCQDLLLSILEGDLKVQDLAGAVKPAVAKRNAMFSLFNRSLDAPAAYDENGDALTFLDILPSDYEPILGKRSVRRMNSKEALVTTARPANAEMIEGFRDGYDLTAPEPSANRSASYRHGFANGRDDVLHKRPRDSFENIVKQAEAAMAEDDKINQARI